MKKSVSDMGMEEGITSSTSARSSKTTKVTRDEDAGESGATSAAEDDDDPSTDDDPENQKHGLVFHKVRFQQIGHTITILNPTSNYEDPPAFLYGQRKQKASALYVGEDGDDSDMHTLRIGQVKKKQRSMKFRAVNWLKLGGGILSSPKTIAINDQGSTPPHGSSRRRIAKLSSTGNSFWSSPSWGRYATRRVGVTFITMASSARKWGRMISEALQKIRTCEFFSAPSRAAGLA
ncbi:hypothetical protein P152DRAFT_264740 [Eremomyces bilateralis CBS 781.70]|uniref:Uncharacterized protein n=1 Tax=Eremomyces bilateralis CBS 781.70 TaxID=1392243 RepID=A0A6G1G871_9PEZI|nr:uncharacterized protein P152DRAFT_264740 [Eremomyces bilateralis CBS 781.70]KAF1814223.1 hypothetical protein P152DRAFT_264740 [Eremomyces bilateralis CBS 781.70]